mmetsp:Transcript_62667/g.148432  ORF Transcript_62667/g.148432 Transcript_62667/m.148432 type:complete len:80 (-) Transcript_62667:54-293(-)
MATGSADGSAWLVDTTTWQPVAKTPVDKKKGHKDEVAWCVFNPAGSKLITASDDTTVRAWDIPESLQPSASTVDMEDVD